MIPRAFWLWLADQNWLIAILVVLNMIWDVIAAVFMFFFSPIWEHRLGVAVLIVLYAL